MFSQLLLLVFIIIITELFFNTDALSTLAYLFTLILLFALIGILAGFDLFGITLCIVYSGVFFSIIFFLFRLQV